MRVNPEFKLRAVMLLLLLELRGVSPVVRRALHACNSLKFGMLRGVSPDVRLSHCKHIKLLILLGLISRFAVRSTKM